MNEKERRWMLEGIENEIAAKEAELRELREKATELRTALTPTAKNGNRRLSPASRSKLSESMRKRWDERHKQQVSA